MTQISTLVADAESEVHQQNTSRLPSGLAYTWATEFMDQVSSRFPRLPHWETSTDVSVAQDVDILPMPTGYHFLRNIYNRTDDENLDEANYDDFPRAVFGSTSSGRPLTYSRKDVVGGITRFRLSKPCDTTKTFAVDYWRHPDTSSARIPFVSTSPTVEPDIPANFHHMVRRYIVLMGSVFVTNPQGLMVRGDAIEEFIRDAGQELARGIARKHFIVQRMSTRTLQRAYRRGRY